MKTLQDIKVDIARGRKPCYVYFLFKPDGTPFYIGIGRSKRRKDLLKRTFQKCLLAM